MNMETTQNVTGQIFISRSFTENEFDIIVTALNESGQRDFVDVEPDFGAINANENSDRLENFPEFIISLVNLKGLEGLVWSGEFETVKQNGTTPIVSKIGVG